MSAEREIDAENGVLTHFGFDAGNVNTHFGNQGFYLQASAECHFDAQCEWTLTLLPFFIISVLVSFPGQTCLVI